MSLEIRPKQSHPNTRFPLTLIASQPDLKTRWLSEINQYAADPLTLHEHNVDDLRIDSTQIKPDSEYEHFHLPIRRKASYESDGIRPSEVAKDYFLTEEERAFYAKQHAEDQKILQQQQKVFDQQKNSGLTQTKSQIQTQTQTQAHTQRSNIAQIQAQQSSVEVSPLTSLISEEKGKIETETVTQIKSVEQKETKLNRSAAIEQTTIENKPQIESVDIKTDTTKQTIVDKKRNIVVTEDSKRIDSAETTKKEEQKEQKVKQEQQEKQGAQLHQQHKEKLEEIKITEKSENRAQIIQEAGNPNNVTVSETIAVGSEDSVNRNNQVKFDVDDKNLTKTLIDNNNIVEPIVTMHDDDNTTVNALDMLTKLMPVNSPQDANTNTNNASRNENASSTPNNQIALNNQAPLHRLQTISIFNFGDRPGAPGRPPAPNLPDFLVPPHLITYETSIEINLRKIPPPQPPPPPKFIKKMLVHTESLERRTRAFLTGNFEVGTTDSSLRTARQKIRSLKSTILKSDDEVKHAEDTITKAQSGDFINIFAPPIVEPPLYEFIEVPSSQRSEDECSENLDPRSERGQSAQQQELENMEDYYSSKYSSRSSRRRVEGNLNIHFYFRIKRRMIDDNNCDLMVPIAILAAQEKGKGIIEILRSITVWGK